MPQNIPLDEQEFWLNAAGDAADGGNGVLPFGADAKTLAEARGSQPFFPRLEWLQKQLVLVGTGGLLNGLAVAGSGTPGRQRPRPGVSRDYPPPGSLNQ